MALGAVGSGAGPLRLGLLRPDANPAAPSAQFWGGGGIGGRFVGMRQTHMQSREGVLFFFWGGGRFLWAFETNPHDPIWGVLKAGGAP